MGVVQTSPVTDGIIAFCETQLQLLDSTMKVGDGKAPDGFGPGYLVVYRVASGFEDQGSWLEPGDQRYIKYQFSSVGETRRHAEAILDAVVGPFTELGDGGPQNPITVVGHTVLEQSIATDIGVGSQGEFTSLQHVKVLVARLP